MAHYVVINDWATKNEGGVEVLGVAHDLSDAQGVFNTYITGEKQHAENHNYTVYIDTDTEFDAGEDGYYSTEHSKMYIIKIIN